MEKDKIYTTSRNLPNYTHLPTKDILAFIHRESYPFLVQYYKGANWLLESRVLFKTRDPLTTF